MTGKRRMTTHEVQDRLGGEQRNDADGNEAAEGFARGGGDFDAGDEENDVGRQDRDGADEAELFADDGEDHVVLCFGDTAADGDFAGAFAGGTAGAHRRQGAHLLEAGLAEGFGVIG